FATMGIPLHDGRTFAEHDDANAPSVAIVNEAFAKAIWPGRPALGKRFHIGGPKGPLVEIVGVAANIQALTVGESPRPYVFVPLSQSYRPEMTLLVHTASDPTTVAAPLRAIVGQLDPSLPVFDVRTMYDHLRN